MARFRSRSPSRPKATDAEPQVEDAINNAATKPASKWTLADIGADFSHQRVSDER